MRGCASCWERAAREWREHRLEQTEIATMQDEQDRLCARVCAVPDHSVSSVQIPRKATSTCRVCMSMNQYRPCACL